MNCRTALGIGVVAAMGFGMSAHAATYSFMNITNNNAADAAAGEAQLWVNVSDYGAGQVLFTFGNSGSLAMSITDVYFDDGTLLGIADLIDSDDNSGDSGVDFSQGASPGDLPGGGTQFNATAGFTTDSDAPVSHNGVNPGETLGVIFDLKAGKTFASVIEALSIGFPEGGLVIGIHVQGFEGGGSESFINNGPMEIVPLPAGVTLGAAGLAPLALRRRRRA